MKKRIVVVGGSAGALQPLQDMLRPLPSDFPAPILIATHLSSSAPSQLSEILGRGTKLRVCVPADNEAIEPGSVYVAQPDRHLWLSPEHTIRLTRGPKENHWRPSIDVLFRSAALSYDGGTIGVVLSGALDDGTAGLWAIKHAGGTAVVQDPDEALHRSMPESALRYVETDHVAAAPALAALLTKLVQQDVVKPGKAPPMMRNQRIENAIARAEQSALRLGALELGAPTLFTCPECHGTLMKLMGGGVPRFRCHTGHAYSIGSLLASLSTSIESSLWNAIRGTEERILLLNHLAEHLREQDHADAADLLLREARVVQRGADRLRQLVVEQADETGVGEAPSHDPVPDGAS